MTDCAGKTVWTRCELRLEDRLTVTVPEAAQLLSISRSTAYAAAKAGQLPTLRLGRRLVVPVPALRDLLGLQRPNGEMRSEVE